ncbi:MAG: YicC/YloC family endoribonuclease, partial [Pseudomonadota bacterium]
MTGFASAEGQAEGWRWSWDIRAVNGRGCDIRLRIPDQIEGLDAALRSAVQKVVARGNVTLSLKLFREDGAGPGVLNSQALTETLRLIGRIEEAATREGVTLRDPSAVEILSLKGVVDHVGGDRETEPLRGALSAGIAPLLSDFDAARCREGRELERIIRAQVDDIAAHVSNAKALLQTRSQEMEASFRAALARLSDLAEGVDEARIAQELAV